MADAFSNYSDLWKSLQDLSSYNKTQSINDMTRSMMVSGNRTGNVLTESIGKYNTEYGLNMEQQLSQLGLQANTQRLNQANMWGGTDPFTGSSIQGQYPFQAEQSSLQRQWQAEQMNSQSSSGLLGSIFGAAGSFLGGNPFGIFGQSPLNQYFSSLTKGLGGGSSSQTSAMPVSSVYTGPQ